MPVLVTKAKKLPGPMVIPGRPHRVTDEQKAAVKEKATKKTQWEALHDQQEVRRKRIVDKFHGEKAINLPGPPDDDTEAAAHRSQASWDRGAQILLTMVQRARNVVAFHNQTLDSTTANASNDGPQLASPSTHTRAADQPGDSGLRSGHTSGRSEVFHTSMRCSALKADRETTQYRLCRNSAAPVTRQQRLLCCNLHKQMLPHSQRRFHHQRAHHLMPASSSHLCCNMSF